MAIDICSEISSLSISPRISFSHDLNQLDQHDHHHHHHHHHLQNDQHLDHNSVSDFDFCVIKNDSSFTFEFSSADELFSNGKILPVQIKTTSHPQKRSDHQGLVQQNDTSAKKIRLKEFLSSSYDTDDEEENDNDKKPRTSVGNNYMSFWKFRRSSSLNLEKIKSLHFTSRSNSTGSAQPTRKPSLQKQQSANSSSSSSKAKSDRNYKRSSSFSSYYNYRNDNVNLSSKSFLRKSNSSNNNNNNNNNNYCNIGGGSQYYGNGNNGVRVSPVLNLPQPYISKVTISFFGFGSLFCNGKVRKKKK